MSDDHQHRFGDHEDTTRLPLPPEGTANAATEPTATLPPYEQSAPPAESLTTGPASADRDWWDAAAPPASAAPSPTKRRGRGVGLLVGSLLLGTAGGVGGAAGYVALTDDEPATTSSSDGQVRTTVTEGSGSSQPAPAGSAEAVAAQVLPSVVKINVSGDDGSGSGSGIILSADGEILTNDHVVEVAGDGGDISVSFADGTRAEATIVGTDPVTDLAVIKAKGVSDLTPAKIGSSDDLGVGEGVLAIGSPFGLEATVTSGIVSALNRAVTVGESQAGTDTTYPAIQTDAAINPGNSGGPLVNLEGQVVGVNSSIRTNSSSLGGEGGSIGLGFAIPISKVLPIVDQLRNGQTPTHARLGVTVSNATDGNTVIPGAQIKEVTSGSAGEKAGLEPGDIVVKVNDEPVTSLESLVATIRGYRPGDQVSLTIQRDGKTQTLQATLDSDEDTTRS